MPKTSGQFQKSSENGWGPGYTRRCDYQKYNIRLEHFRHSKFQKCFERRHGSENAYTDFMEQEDKCSPYIDSM